SAGALVHRGRNRARGAVSDQRRLRLRHRHHPGGRWRPDHALTERGMDFTPSADDDRFREEVRAFFRHALPEDLAQKQRQGFYLSGEDIRRWQRILYDRGWAAPGWPKEFGGPGFTPMQRYIFEDETGLNDAPDPA